MKSQRAAQTKSTSFAATLDEKWMALRLGQDADWRAFQSKGRPMLRDLNNVLLQPTNYSPLK
mgnify:CR=1 FL=1